MQVSSLLCTVPEVTRTDCCECYAEQGDVLREVGVFVAMELCSTWNKLQRLQREQPLLLKEMNGYLSYFQRQLDNLRSQMAAIPANMTQPANTQPASAAPVLQVRTEVSECLLCRVYSSVLRCTQRGHRSQCVNPVNPQHSCQMSVSCHVPRSVNALSAHMAPQCLLMHCPLHSH